MRNLLFVDDFRLKSADRKPAVVLLVNGITNPNHTLSQNLCAQSSAMTQALDHR